MQEQGCRALLLRVASMDTGTRSGHVSVGLDEWTAPTAAPSQARLPSPAHAPC